MIHVTYVLARGMGAGESVIVIHNYIVQSTDEPIMHACISMSEEREKKREGRR